MTDALFPVKREAEPCKWCGGMATIGTVCPYQIGCATCGALPGRSCKRPSGHRAAQLHAARVRQAETMAVTP